MARLSAKARRAIPAKNFAEPGKRAYPIEDASHARNALARVSEFGSAAEKSQVRAAVARKYPSMSHHDFNTLDHGKQDHMKGRK